ncbi:MAG: tRNA uridine-5-carboxymethylaminomethyl(34) synthesis GTPase MnmE [Dongiaceae bacterium]
MTTDTIYAPASAVGRAGVSVVRISGPEAAMVLQQLAGTPMPAPRRAVLRQLRDPKHDVVLDEGIVLWMPGPRSFTGEDVGELHLHGGRAVLRAVFEALGDMGLRLAEPGEFTRRAFEHGKLDLTAAEGLADLVNAETEAQRRQALRQLGGELGRLYDTWRNRLVESLARLEAHIDFPDENLPANLMPQIRERLRELLAELAGHLDDRRRGERLRDGLSVALLGAPNVGKSSLINHLAQRDVAIVATEAGTTRDVIEVHLDLAGYPVVVADTAGLREAGNLVEAEGVRRALARAAAADLKILMFDAQRYPALDGDTAGLIDQDAIVVLSRCDLAAVPAELLIRGQTAMAVSVRTGAGMDRLLAALSQAVAERAGLGDMPALTRERHRQALVACRDALFRALVADAPELLAEDLRLAVTAIGRITGRVDVEDILDVIFREFCIGK